MENESNDSVLKNLREQDRQIREQKIYDSEKAEAEKAKATASPDDINRMNKEDQANGLPKNEWRSYRW